MSTITAIICEQCGDIFSSPYDYTAHNNKEHRDVWDLLEDPTRNAESTAHLIQWSTNYDMAKGTPYHIFLDLIGYSESEYGAQLFTGDPSRVIGYMEADILGDALKEYASHPQDVLDFIELVSNADMRDN